MAVNNGEVVGRADGVTGIVSREGDAAIGATEPLVGSSIGA